MLQEPSQPVTTSGQTAGLPSPMWVQSEVTEEAPGLYSSCPSHMPGNNQRSIKAVHLQGQQAMQSMSAVYPELPQANHGPVWLIQGSLPHQ